MAEETNKPEAADDALDQAALDAVASQEQEVSDDTAPEVSEETDQDGLPIDQGPRSDLGRKVAAIHRRQDEFDAKIDRMLQLMENQQQPDEEELDYDAPLTRKEALDLIQQQKEQEAKTETQYQETYVSSFAKLTRDLPENEYGLILDELKKMTYDRTNNPARDAEINFLKAKLAVAEKTDSPRVNPLKGNKPKSELGTATNSKNQTKESALPDLDDVAQNYLNFVAREDGQEKASALHKSMAK